MRSTLRDGQQVLWLAHRSELIDQAVADFVMNGTDSPKRFTVGRFQAGKLKAESEVDVLVASIPSLAWGGNRQVRKLRGLVPRLGLIVVDECHHSSAGTWRSLILHLKKSFGRARFLGLTATPFRSQQSDENTLYRLYDENLLHSEHIMSLIEKRILAQPIIHDLIHTKLRFEATDADQDDFNRWGDLSKRLVNDISGRTERNRIIATHVLSNINTYGQTLLFAGTI